jgi:2-hydroxy-3-keto-5-methylthiopentenyl-1-phosphate phosphatase|tara:strand:- start:154 stop:471 length:318 start_codon:yes stop_codon:yes gene_type:complete
MNIKKLDKRSKLFNFGYTYKIEEHSMYLVGNLIDDLLRQIVGKDKFKFVDMSQTLNEMHNNRHKGYSIYRYVYECDALYHYNSSKRCKAYYIRNESTLAMLKMAL